MSQTADRYAKALFELAQDQHNLETVQSNLVDIKKLILDSKEFKSFLTNPLLALEEQSTVLKAIFDGKVPVLLYQFLVFIAQKNRLNILEDIIESFDAMYLASTQQMRVSVKTALPITDEEKGFINQKLADKFHQKIITQWNIDPSLIGGFRIFAQGKLYDYSFKNQLDHFLQQTT